MSMFFLVILLVGYTTVTADEANCHARTRRLYYSGVCQLPYGAEIINNDTTIPYNLSKCQQDESEGGTEDLLLGILISLCAAFAFGSQFVPTKKFNTGDGMYFQWMMAIGAWLVGLVVNLTQSQPPFFSLTMLSGVLWGSGNIFSVPSFYFVGIGIGQTMQGNLNLLGGWISGRFILCSHIKNHIGNTVGVVLVIMSSILLSFVKVDTKNKKKSIFFYCKKLCFKSSLDEDKSLLFEKSKKNVSQSYSINDDVSINDDNIKQDDRAINVMMMIEKLQNTKVMGKIVGLSFAIFSGLLLGFQYLPIEILRRCENEFFPCNELSYSFGMFIGILFTSTFWFFLYCVFMKFKPNINSKLTVPALISGVLYGIGNVCWLISNQKVGLPISFPIITAGSSIVSCMWGVLVFREISGWKNLGLFIFAFVIVVAGIITVGIS